MNTPTSAFCTGIAAVGLFAAQMAAAADFETAYQSIGEEGLRTDIATLAADEFEGRAPGTRGEKLTLDYLEKRLAEAGIGPGNGDSYRQPVELVQITPTRNPRLSIGGKSLKYRKDFVATTRRMDKRVQLRNSELIFVGYGIDAPEYGWNDYAGLDLKGKTLVMLVNDPGFATRDPNLFTGAAMTYYGRWSYKFDTAGIKGAAGVLIVHEEAPASYGWQVVENSWSNTQSHLPRGSGADRVPLLEGWLSLEAAKKLFARAGEDFAGLKAAAAGPGFKAVPLGIKLSGQLRNRIETSTSYNILGTLPGRTRPDEHLVYSAHWDHIGVDADRSGDNIYNGARDNASGVAGALAIATAFASLEPAPERSVSFLLLTAEEQGLLGSKHFARQPLFPLTKIVGILNMDSLNITGRMKDIRVVGRGQSELEDYLGEALVRQGRTLSGDPRPQAGYYYRSDHFSFARKGVPGLYASGGSDPIDPALAAKWQAVADRCYHQPCDEYSPDWNLAGAVEDLRAFFDVGHRIANSKKFPNWKSGSEFKAIRDAAIAKERQ